MFRLLPLILALVLTFGLAHAQNITELSVTAKGFGSVRGGSSDGNVNETSVSLITNGSAIISSKGDSSPRFRGK